MSRGSGRTLPDAKHVMRSWPLRFNTETAEPTLQLGGLHKIETCIGAAASACPRSESPGGSLLPLTRRRLRAPAWHDGTEDTAVP